MKHLEIKERKVINTSSLTYIGETITEKIRKVKTTGEAIESVSPIIYTERKDGVLPEYDIRSDKWDIAQKSMQYVNDKKIEKRLEKQQKLDEPSQQSK